MASEKPTSKGQAWFCTTGLPSDIIVEVDDMTFHLHKFPLMSKSLKLHELITEQEKRPKPKSAKFQKLTEQEKDNTINDDGVEIEEEVEEPEDDTAASAAAADDDDDEEMHCHITLPDFPGGSEAFEAAAKFCYGVKIEVSPSNLAPLRCAGEVLQMTEEYSEENLISKTERYLSQSLKNIKDSIQILHSCEKLLPLAENLGIVERCIEAIATKASSTDPSLFGWPMSDKGILESAATGTANNARRKLTSAAARAGSVVAGPDVWFDELALLSLQFFKRLIFAMREGDLSGEIIENCLVYYAKKCIPGISSRANRKSSSSSSSSSSIPSENEQRELLETVITNLPKEKSPTSSTATRFLFGLLRTANILNSSEPCRTTLEKKIGSQLEQATLDDLLIPSYSYLNETLYDVDCVERILGYFLQGLEDRIQGDDENSSVRSAALMLVGKLIDGFLSEIASDANLKPDRFYQLAVSLPDHARLFDDGLYRAVDVYLKAHPWISESEREKICGILDCQKLTLEACTHAAQNERLPLRAVVQVLFFEQLQLRHAIAGTLLAAEVPPALETGRQSVLGGGGEEDEEEEVGGIGLARAGEGEGNGSTSTWRAAVRENQVLRLDMDSMRTRVHELERECSAMKMAIEKIDKVGPRSERKGNAAGGGGWRSKFGCKFKTQVCDSHESATVVEARKGRSQRHQ